MEIRKMSQSELDKAIEEEIERVWRQNDFVSTGQVVGLLDGRTQRADAVSGGGLANAVAWRGVYHI